MKLHPLSQRLRTERLTGKQCLSEIVVTCSRRVIARKHEVLTKEQAQEVVSLPSVWKDIKFAANNAIFQASKWVLAGRFSWDISQQEAPLVDSQGYVYGYNALEGVTRTWRAAR